MPSRSVQSLSWLFGSTKLKVTDISQIPGKSVYFDRQNAFDKPLNNIRMKNRTALTVIGTLALGFALQAQKPAAPGAPAKMDFRYSPPEWQTAICLPDDPHKSLVDKSGELLYHYGQGGREFGTRIRVVLTEDVKWIGQELYSPRVPIVITHLQAEGLEITQEAFAVTGAPVVSLPDNALKRVDDGTVLTGWASPGAGFDASLRDINVHMDGNIQYELLVPAGSSRLIALALCEGYWGVPGRRILKMQVEGKEARTVDMVAEFGKNKPQAFWFEARDADVDGKIKISVDAAPQATDKNTILNGLWVFDSGTKADSEALLKGRMNAAAKVDLNHLTVDIPGRDDIVVVQVKNTGKAPRAFTPELIINTILPLTFKADNGNITLNGQELVSASLKMAGIVEKTRELSRIRLETQTLAPGEGLSFYLKYSNGKPAAGSPGSMEEVLASRAKAIEYWEKKSQLPFDRIRVPDPGIQALVESSVRNIWEAREIKGGLPVFQVGPTCYRGLWIVDGAFLLEAAAMLGAGDQARNGVASELKTQQPDGRIQSLAKDFWKENGLVIWTCVRHAQLTQDKVWLESVWPKLQLVAEFIKTLRKETLTNKSLLDDGMNPAGTLDGGIGGPADEYTNSYWNLTGLKAFIQAARWLGKSGEAAAWQQEYDSYMTAFEKAAKRDMAKDPYGNAYLPILMGPDGKKELPQRAQWAFCQAVYPGQLFPKDDPIVTGNMAMLEATEREEMVYGTGWDATGIWNYFASFYGHAWLWQGSGQKAAKALYAFGNHAAPTLVWREEQSLMGAPFRKVGDMPHNWASAEFIRLAIHLLALDRGDDLHLLEGMPVQWTRPGMVTSLTGVATPFGALTMEVKVADDGKSARLRVDPLTDPSCRDIVVHLDGWTGSASSKVIRLNPDQKNEITIPIKKK
jgi:hypothetical protein